MRNDESNIILETDSYKLSHPSLYPYDTQRVFLYGEARVGAKWPRMVFFGLSYWLQRYLTGPVVTYEKIHEARQLLRDHFGKRDIFQSYRWDHIIQAHGGRLPLEIKSLPEGSLVDRGNALFTVENTCPECYWLPGHVDSMLTQTWATIAVATLSWTMKQTIRRYVNKTCDDAYALPFMLHDFGFRGSMGVEAAALTGAAHLVNFEGTDTLPALRLLRDYYGNPCAGFSVPATEHTVTITHGRDYEVDAFERALRTFPDGIISIVADSYNLTNAVSELIGERLRELIINRPGKVVVRPDSGEPTKIVPAVLATLARKFGVTHNSKYFAKLPPFIGVIQGDHVYDDTIGPILESVTTRGFAADNVVFGCGGGLRRVERNDVDEAVKCSHVTIADLGHDVSKSPATDMMKRSKAGRLSVITEDDFVTDRKNVFRTILTSELGRRTDQLRTVYKNGEMLYYPSLTGIRHRLESYNAD